MTRTVVRASRAVAAQHWTRPFAEVVAAAETGETGLRVEIQETDTAGFWRLDNKPDEATLIKGRSGNCELWQQGW